MDAQLNELIRLKQPLAPPVERWQMLPARHVQKAPRSEVHVSSPLRVRTCNMANVPTAKTPDKLAVKYKKTPRKTPGHSSKTPHSKRRTPPKSGRKKTPGRAGQSPSGCRFIPNRSTTDLEYSSYLLQRQEGEREEEEEEMESPGREEYRHALLKAVSKSRPRAQSQRGVLSFSATTPSMGEGTQPTCCYTHTFTGPHTQHILCSERVQTLDLHLFQVWLVGCSITLVL